MTPTTRPTMDELLPCPFCGAPAEMDAGQGYLAIPSGKLGSRVTIYCTSCAADMGWCREDHPGMPVEEMIHHVREDWNRRATTHAGEGMVEEVLAICADHKARADVPKRDDWQLGYAAACREIAVDVRRLSPSKPAPVVEASRLQAIIAELKSFPPSPLIEDAIDSLERIS